jgi:endonuclease YncB( thermonuclease family)
MALRIFWTPNGVNLDQLGEKKLREIVDGDTPKIDISIRMLSIDTPEKSVTARGLSKDEIRTLTEPTRNWIASGASPVPSGLAAHLLPRLDRPDVAEAHWKQGAQATDFHKQITDERLAKPGGGTRRMFLRAADERFDQYGRLLAYTAPSYDFAERQQMTRRERATFNFNMIDQGWAATLIIYPSIPGELDLPMVQDAARRAVEEQRGAWADPQMLTGYEYRMLERLVLMFQKVEAGKRLSSADLGGWITRYCADISTGEIYAPTQYYRVAPWNRLFLWRNDVRAAVGQLNLHRGDAADADA